MNTNLNHNATSLRLKKQTLERLRSHANYGDSMDTVINNILDDAERYRRPKPRNSKGQFAKKESRLW